MKLFLSFLTFMILLHISNVSSQNTVTHAWVKQIGGPGYDALLHADMDRSGNFYMIGEFSGTVDFDPGPDSAKYSSVGATPSIFFAKYNSDGEFIWVKRFNYARNIRNMYIDNSGNIIMTGNFMGLIDFEPSSTSNMLNSSNGQLFIAKYSTDGTLQWVWQYPIRKTTPLTTDDEFLLSTKVSFDNSDNIYLTRSFIDTFDADPSNNKYELISDSLADIAIVKLDSSGNFLWAKQLSGSNSNIISHSIINDYSANFYLTGSFNDTIDLDLGSGTYFLSGESYLQSFIAKYDANGSLLKATTYRGNLVTAKLQIDPQENLYLTGIFNDSLILGSGPFVKLPTNYSINQYFISKFDSLFDLSWAYTFWGSAIDFDQNANVYVRYLNVMDLATIKMNSNFSLIWAEFVLMCSQYNISPGSLNFYNSTLFFAGSFRDDTYYYNINGTPLPLKSKGDFDIYFIKLNDFPLGIVEKKRSILAYPNPFKNKVTIDMGDISGSKTITIYDITGRVILQKQSHYDQKIDIYIPGSSGMYIIEIVSHNGRVMYKVIKE